VRCLLVTLFARKKSIFQVIEEHRAAILRNEEKTVRELISQYRGVDRYIYSKLVALEKLIAEALTMGEDPGSWLFDQARYKDLISQIERRVDLYAAKAESTVEKSQRTAAALGSKQAVELMKVEVGVRRAFTTLNPSAIETMVGVFHDGSPLVTLFETFGSSAVAKARDALVTGIGVGESPRKVARRLGEEIQGLSRDRALRISRNETLRVLTTVQARTYEANADVCTGMMIVESLDSRTCMLCWARHGTILQLGEGFPRHIACRGSLTPVTTTTRKRATGEQEFFLKSADEQKEILGASRYKLWSEGKIQLSDIYTVVNDKTWGPKVVMKPMTKLQTIIKPAGTYKPSGPPNGVVSVIKEREARGIIAK
jgi:SPP1 gp7 family putative phage head morphogenesis protein